MATLAAAQLGLGPCFSAWQLWSEWSGESAAFSASLHLPQSVDGQAQTAGLQLLMLSLCLADHCRW